MFSSRKTEDASKTAFQTPKPERKRTYYGNDSNCVKLLQINVSHPDTHPTVIIGILAYSSIHDNFIVSV